MGGGWLGGGWQGGGWQGGGWQGGGWQGGGWQTTGGIGGTYAMRADQPLVAKNTDPTFMSPKFPNRYWDSDLHALTILPDFFTATLGAGGPLWHQHITVPPPPVVHPAGYTGPVNPGDDSIDDLRILAVTERPEAMGEILNQAFDQQLCFMNLLMMSQSSHPRTFFAMKLAARVGEVVMMRLKRQWNRPRPTQYCPTLYPPVPVPGHAAYPAGHALIATLTAAVLKEATNDPGIGKSPYEKSLDELADGIGLNRVIAGLHFRSDITAGAAAGVKTHAFLKGMVVPAAPPPPPAALPPPSPPFPAVFTYTSVIQAAQKEWFTP